MAIHIDIYAHLRDRELIKEGERILQLVEYYEREANQRAVRGARGRSKQIVAAQDKHDAAFDQSINKIDDFRNAVNAAGAAQQRLTEIQETAITETYTQEKKTDDLRQAQRDLARSMQNIILKGQALTRAVNTETRERANLNDVTKDYTRNAKEVTRITNINRKELTKLSRSTNKLRRDTENLHAANIGIFQDNKKITKSMEDLSAATEKSSRAREKYSEIRKKEGVRGSEIKAAGRVLKDALVDEARKAQDVSDVLVETIRQRRDHDSAVNRNETSLRSLANQSLQLEQRTADLRSANRDVIDQNKTLTRQFDRVNDSVLKVSNEYRKYHEMSQDVSVSSDALANQMENVNRAFVEQQRAARDASLSLDDYYRRQEDGERRAEEASRRRAEQDIRRLRPQSMGRYFARNLGALTPLGTLSPSTLLPLAGLLGSIGEGAVTASQSLALLPAAGVAAAAGIGTLVIGMNNFGAALTGMGDPKKFAEALYLLSPNAQQAALSIKSLVDGPLGDLKRSTQDALFANVGGTIEKLTQTLGPSIQRVTTSIATSFNRMFTGISLEMMSPEGAAQVDTITKNIADMFDRLEPAVSAFNSAFMRLAETGSGFLPKLADSLTSVMTKFDAFLAKAQADGSLEKFISKGIDAIAALSKWLLGFGQDIYEVFGNKSPQEFMSTLEGLKEVIIGLGKLLVAVAGLINDWGPAIGEVVDSLGGFQNVLYTLVGFGFASWLVKIYKLFKDLKSIIGLIGPAAATASNGIAGVSTAAAIASGSATTAAAKQTGANAATTFAAAGTTAGKGWGAKLITALKGLSLVGLGTMIALPIVEEMDAALKDWMARQTDNPEAWKAETQRQQDRNWLPQWTGPLAWFEGLIRNIQEGVTRDDNGNYVDRNGNRIGVPPSKDSFYEDWYPAGVNPAGPGPMDPGYQFPLPNVPLDKNGKALTDSEILNQIRGQLSRDLFAVDPFTDPITGQKLNPMLPIGPNGLPEYPAGGVPGTPSIQGPVMPQYNSFGQITGYGANMVDPEAVFDAQLGVTDKARDLEEAKKDLLAAQQAGILSAEEVNDLERKVLDAKLQLHKSLVALGKAQTGDIEKLKNSTNDALGEFGVQIDKDFGISKGLAGIAENITRFIAGLAFAPAFGAMRGKQTALGFPGGEGTGYGLAGAFAVSQGYYKGGPMDTGVQPGPGYTPSYNPSVGPQPGGVGFGSGPGTSRADIKGINLSTIPVAAQQYANNCIDAAAQIILSANGVQLTQDQIEKTIARGGSIDSLAAGLNRLDPSGGYVPIPASGGSPEALLSAVQNSINKGNGSILNVAPGSSIAGRNFPAGHFIAVTGYDPNTGRINLSDTADGSVYSVTAGEAFQSSRGRGLVAGMGLPGGPPLPQGPVYGPPLPKYATGGEVPIMAHSGEHVLTREDVAALGGQAGVYSFRRSLHSYEGGGAIPLAPFSPDPFDPSNIPDPFASSKPKDVVRPTDLGSLLGVGDVPAAPAPKVPAVPAVPAPVVPPVSEAPAVPAPPLPTVPNTVLPPGIETPGSVIGAQVEAPAGYGSGFQITGGGIAGLAGQALQMAATSGAAGGGAMAGGGGGGAAAAIASLGMETAIKLGERGIEYGAQVAGIATQGLLETLLPAGGSELASNNWLTRIVGGIAGAAPAMANLAGGKGASNQGILPGVGAPTPEQVAAQGMDPNRAEHTGSGAPAGPYTGVNIQNYVVQASEDRAGQDIVRYLPAPGAR